MIQLEAPAKLNLTLEVLGRRGDGYHELRSILQSISLHDTLTFRPADSLEYTCDMPGWQAERSLVSKAARLLAKACGCSRGAAVGMKKNIPLVAGLGGDSSDAAAVIMGLNKLWELGLDEARMEEIAARLGSDVPFFIRRGTALAGGIGEVLTPLPAPKDFYAVIIVPDTLSLTDKTRRLYESLKPDFYTLGKATKKLEQSLRQGKVIEPSMLFNVFENVAFDTFKGLDDYRKKMLHLGAGSVHLCGSGPSLYSVVKSEEAAKNLAERFNGSGMKAYTAAVQAAEPRL